MKNKLFLRFLFVCAFLLVSFVGVILKVVYIQAFEREEWLDLASNLKKRDKDIAPNRGNIYTHDGKLISATIPYYTLLMDTRVPALHEKGGRLYLEHIDTLAESFANYFGDRTKEQYKQHINDAYLAGNGQLRLYPERVSYIDMNNVRQFPLIKRGRYKSGFMTREFANRENLFGSLGARTVGNVYGAGQGGQYGLELEYDSILCGKPGKARGIRVGTGWVYEDIEDPIDGRDLITTIDIELQDICDKALRDMLVKTDAARGCLLLMDVKTGAIRVSVNLSRAEPGVYKESYNMSVADLSEPGSTFKTMSLMVALEDGVCSLEDSIMTYDGIYKFDGIPQPMTDHNRRKGGYGTITLEKAIAVSSNIGVSRVIDDAYREEPEKFVDAIYKTKLMDDMGIEIPGAAVPKIPHPDTDKKWSLATLPWMSIGYGVQMPPIYTLAFYNAIANGGKMMRPYFVEAISSQGVIEREFKPKVINSSICSSSTLNKLHRVLEGVMDYGTGASVSSQHVKIAGKTGTTQLNYGKAGVRVSHMVSFCGYFPADEPKYTAIVVIRQPRVGYASGSIMAGGVFKNIAERVNAHEVQLEIDDVAEERADSVLPLVFNGHRKLTEQALDYLGIDNDLGKTDWVRVGSERVEDGFVSENIPVVEGYIPDVRGMGAKDAVYIIEKLGLRPQIYGRGRVVRQSIAPKTKVRKGSTLTIILK